MNHIKLTTIILGLFLLGCKQKEEKIIQSTNDNLINKKSEYTQNESDFVDNDSLEKDEITAIKNVINLFKQKDNLKLAKFISFPLQRKYPIPSIKNEEQLILRFNEVFDKILINKIANSKIEQWTKVGWRGIMFDNGTVWISNSNGKIAAVNYQSSLEKKIWFQLVNNEKENLHLSLKTFVQPTYKFKTKNYLIRIDELINNKYRYASWKIGENESSKPDMILDGGHLEFDGSGGNHVITFVNGNYKYKVYRNTMGGDNSPDITIEIDQEGKNILTQDGTLVIE
tara:strand:- start:4879 stop:5730 length:852 start_codon:yes stop_codon:yes gene_type:complete